MKGLNNEIGFTHFPSNKPFANANNAKNIQNAVKI